MHRGRRDEAARLVNLFQPWQTSADAEERAFYWGAESRLLLAQGNAAEALAAAETAFSARESLGITAEFVKETFGVAVEAALALGDLDKAEELLASLECLPAGRLPQFLRAQTARFRARLRSDRADDLFKGAGALFRELAVPFYLAVTELEHAEWLATQDRFDEAKPLLAEARETFERLEARPWLDRLGQPTPVGRETEAVTAGS